VVFGLESSKIDIHVWDNEGNELRHFGSGGPYGPIGPWAFSADGRYMAVEHDQAEALYDKDKLKDGKDPRPCRFRLAVDLWDTATGKRRGTVGREAPPVVSDPSREGRVTGQLAKVGAESGGFRVHALPGDRFLLLPDYNRPPPAFILKSESPRKIRGDDEGFRKELVLLESATGKELYRFEDFVDGQAGVWAASPNGNTVVAAGRLNRKEDREVLLIWNVSDLTRSPRRPADYSDAELATMVDDLSEADASKAFRAMRALAAVPERAAPLLADRVRPAEAGPVPEPLIADLDSDDFDVREKASRALERLGEAARPALVKAQANKPSADAGRRIAELLNKIDGGLPDDLRGARAVDVLERIGTAKAKATLKELAGGAADALTTQAAKDALDRLDKRPADKP
jgi:hypothetical protein